MNGLPLHGEMWWMESSEIGRRPVLVLSRDTSIPRLGRVMFAPATTAVRHLDTEVALDPDHDPVSQPCVLNLDSVGNVGVGMLTDRIGILDEVKLRNVCIALELAVDCLAERRH